MGTRLNETAGYYAGREPPSLFWEMTVSECLATRESPYQRVLERPAPYGEILARFLADRIGLDPSWSVVEVGGGYGSLMGSLLDVVPVARLTMVDVSPEFTRRQQRALEAHPGARFVTADVMDYLGRIEEPVDLVISNENLGDLPTAVGVRKDELLAAMDRGTPDPVLRSAAEAVRRHRLSIAGAPSVFHVNVGAIELLDRLRPVAKAVFLAEHGSDTVLPDEYSFLPLAPSDGYPRRIPLKGHDEYTIRFGHLEQAAESLGYRARRFHMAELLGVRRDAAIRCLARQNMTLTEATEVVHELCGHVAEYQCLLLTR